MRFFFYGTLLDGSDNPVAQAVHARLTPLGPAMARGLLYAIPDPLGWYPALVAGGGRVSGVVYAARSSFTAADLARLDAYEDFTPGAAAASLYLRTSLPLCGGGEAEAYVFNQPLPPGAQAIAGGDFRAWLTMRGLPQFRGAAAT